SDYSLRVVGGKRRRRASLARNYQIRFYYLSILKLRVPLQPSAFLCGYFVLTQRNADNRGERRDYLSIPGCSDGTFGIQNTCPLTSTLRSPCFGRSFSFRPRKVKCGRSLSTV